MSIGVVVFTMKGKISSRVANELAERFQHILARLFPNVRFPGVVRVSLGIGTSEQDIETLIRVLGTIAEKPSSPKSGIQEQMKNFALEVSKKVYSPV